MKRLLILLAACGGESASTPDAPVADAAPACEPVECTTLGGTWSGGMASCRDGGRDVSACTRVDTTSWENVEPAARGFADARCNDGTPFDFVVRLAATPSKRWVIHLEGGGFCDDTANSCAERPLDLQTTSPLTDRQLAAANFGGVLSRNAINPLADANHVRATYCTSDFYAGSTTERRPTLGDPVNGWYFSGHANVAAMFAVLERDYGLDDTDPASAVLFSGSSAGAFGVHFNAAQVTSALAGIASRGQLRLFVDAGWLTAWADPDPAPPAYYFGDATVPDVEVWQRARDVWGATFDPACEAANAEPWRCGLGDVWYPYVAARGPLLVQQSTADAVFTDAHAIDTTAPNPTLAAWRTQVKATLGAPTWLFSGDASYHVLSTSDQGLSRGPAGATLSQVLAQFWADDTPRRVQF